jgi:hypothetical protein
LQAICNLRVTNNKNTLQYLFTVSASPFNSQCKRQKNGIVITEENSINS